MRFTVPRAITATLLLAGTITLAASSPAHAATGPHIDFTPPAVVGAGLTATDLPVEIDNTGGEFRWSVGLRLTVTPVAGSAVRPLASTLVLSYQFGSQWRPLTYVTRDGALIATTPALTNADADGTATIRLRLSAQPTSTAAHVDEMTVDVTTEAVDGSGVAFAADNEPDRVALVEPRAELTGWPQQLPVGTPAVVTATFTNTTPLAYSILRPALVLNRAGNAEVTVERRDGDEWTPVSGPSSSYFWWYADGYPSLQPGESYTATLRVTFNDDAAAGEQGFAYLTGYTYFGYPFAVDIHPYTITARA